MLGSRRLFLIGVLAMALGAVAPAGFAQDITSHARMVRVSYVQGTVEFNNAAAVMNSPVTEESRLVTGTDGLAEVQFEDASVIRLASETTITFAQLARLSSGEAITRVDLDEGEAEFLIPASSAGHFAVNVRGKNILFKQPGRFRVLSTNSTPLEIAVWKGEAGVTDLESGQIVSVRDHETFALNPDDLGQYDLEKSVLADDLDRWSEQRDQDLRTNYVAGNAGNTAYDQYYQSGGGYGGGYGAGFVPAFYYGYNGFGCPYGYGFGQPFWFGSPGYCWNSGFGFNPWFFSPPVVFIVTPPIHPRRPVPIRPPTIPTVAKGGPGNVVTRPEFRSFRNQREGQRVFNDETFQRRTVDAATPAGGQGSSTGNVNEATHTPAIAPGQRGGSTAVAPPVHSSPSSSPAHAPRSSPPPSRPPSHSSYSPPHGSSGGSAPHGSSGGGFSHGSSGGGSSHSSAPASHSSGRSH